VEEAKFQILLYHLGSEWNFYNSVLNQNTPDSFVRAMGQHVGQDFEEVTWS
jgi:hypothetical protein